MPTNYDPSKTPANQIRVGEYAQNDRWIRDFLAHPQVGYVATHWDDQPFITPVNFWYEGEEHKIYFHTNIAGRLRANIERHGKACFTASRTGELLPSNVALEFSIQYESVVAFGIIRLLKDHEQKSTALYGLLDKYFPQYKAGQHYRPITEEELKHTAVYALTIESWSGKCNWHQQAEQSPDWKPLDITS